MTMSYYEIERLLARVASGTTTERDARVLRKILLVHSATNPVAAHEPQR